MNRIRYLCSFLWFLGAAAVSVGPCFAENWPCFRGPTGQGVSQEKNLPLTWSLRENLAWRTQIPGIGWSSPIVWENRVFLTSATPDGTSCHLLCLDTAQGKILWDKEVFRQAANRKMAENSHATPTPVTDGKRVYAAYNGGRIVAVDFNGNVVWDWRDKQFVSKHGLAASPILYGDKLIMPFDGNGPADIDNIGYRIAWDGAFVVALDKRTGQEKWRAKRGLSRQSHVTPMIIEVNGRPQLVSGAGDVVQGFDPDNGQRLWTIRSPGEGVVPSIVYGQGLVFTSSGYGARRFGPSAPMVTTRRPLRTWRGSRGPMCPWCPPLFMRRACCSASRNRDWPRASRPGRGKPSGQNGWAALMGPRRCWPKAGCTAWPKTARRR